MIWILQFVLLLTLTACGGGASHHHHHNHRFTHPEQLSKRWDSPERDAWQQPQRVLDVLALEPGMAVADLGAGTGYFVAHLAKAVGSEGTVWALDIEPEMVRFLTERAAREGWTQVKAVQVPTTAPGLEPESVDRLLTVNTWHHVERRRDYSLALFKAIKPGGMVVVVDYKPEEGIPGAPMKMRLAPSVVIAELEAGGFDVYLSEVSLPRQYIIVARKGR
ncbi:MAG: methyltransferase domain-containing protein [Myxococcota bacterium]